MNIYVHTDHINIPDKENLNVGEYHSRDCIFIFDEEYKDLVKKALFTNEQGNTYEMVITQNKCKIPAEVVDKEGKIILGVYGYQVANNNLILRHSPKPTFLTVVEGSYKEDVENPSTPTPAEWEQVEQAVADLDSLLLNDYYTKDQVNGIIEETFTSAMEGEY